MQEERDGDHSLEKFCSSGGCRADVSGGSVLGRAQIFFVSVCVCVHRKVEHAESRMAAGIGKTARSARAKQRR